MDYAILLLVLTNILLINAESVVVKVEQGLLRGEKLRVVTDDADYLSFKGIPYAKPPIGDLRFLEPKQPESWNGIRNATQHGPTCVQLSIYNNKDISGSEDCLYLNVYTPSIKPTKRLSVMLYIHGGGYQSGSGDSDRYGPDYLIMQNVVVVTINFRLAALGFLCLNTKEVPGNAGIKDQVAAMRWVQKNIANFGGDPNKVTIIGQGTGGTSVGYHNISPLTIGLYKRGIAMSGVPLNDYAWPFEPRRLAFKLGQKLGLWTLDDQKLLTYLKSFPAEKLLGTDLAVLKSEYPNVVMRQNLFAPVVESHDGENNYLTLDAAKALKRANEVDLMIGHTQFEGLPFFLLFGDLFLPLYGNYTEMVVPRKILENMEPKNIFNLADVIRNRYFGDNPIDNSTAKGFVNLISESSFNYGIIKYAKVFSNIGRTFMYKFSILTDFPRPVPVPKEYGIVGSSHEDDLLYLFYPQSSNITINKDSEQYRLVNTVCTLYANFAKYGNPTPDKSLGITWPKYKIGTQYYLDIDSNLSVGQHLDAESVSFWDSIYETAGLAF